MHILFYKLNSNFSHKFFFHFPIGKLYIVNSIVLGFLSALPYPFEYEEHRDATAGALYITLLISQDPNLERNLNDSIAVLPRLATGLDVNVRFTGISDFEFTPELLIFDVLNINLYHGWLVDPQESSFIKIC